MIGHYEFINSKPGSGGLKERLLGATIQLYNKLSAEETNNIRAKLNELVDQVNLLAPPLFPIFALKFKGDGNLNTEALEVGDIVHGFYGPGEIWDNAVYNGGDPEDKANYTNLGGAGGGDVPEIMDGIIGVTADFAVGQQTFTLPPGAKCIAVTLAHAPQYRETDVNASLANLWRQEGDDIIIKKVPALNNYLYIEYI